MATIHEIPAESRKDEGKGASRRLRHAGRIPAVVYGGGSAPASIELDHEPTWLAQQHAWFYASIITLTVDGKAESVLLRDMQRHPYRQLIMHMDFQRVKADQKLHVKVPLHFVNVEKSPAGKSAEATVTTELNEIDIVCLPGNLPEFVEVDLGAIKAGDTVHLSDVKLPKGVELAHAIDAAHNPAVAVARTSKEEVVDDAAPEAAAVPSAKGSDSKPE